MKHKYILALSLMSFGIGCKNAPNDQVTTNEEIPKPPKTIDERMNEISTEYLRSNLNDFARYESIGWSKVDTIYQDYKDTDASKIAQGKADSLRSVWSDAYHKYQYAGDVTEQESKRLEKYSDSLFDIHENMEKQIKYNNEHMKTGLILGYRIDHKFRAPNRYGAMNVSRLRFFSDTSLTNVTNVIDLDNLDRQVQQTLNDMENLTNDIREFNRN
ncbi:hypothetical protein [Edaphocola aurantiacus]|uniref:hypothetical protein n=1 Tax=Edaphocola aurantiacus TaxID=2601682 RepID=UPI001C94128F|nr:hypothetical protein [Edaphocola aurantiacus]